METVVRKNPAGIAICWAHVWTRPERIHPDGVRLFIDPDCGCAKELGDIAAQMREVKYLDADGGRGERLLDRVRELAGSTGAVNMFRAWRSYQEVTEVETA